MACDTVAVLSWSLDAASVESSVVAFDSCMDDVSWSVWVVGVLPSDHVWSCDGDVSIVLDVAVAFIMYD